MNQKLMNVTIMGVVFLTIMSWAHKEFDIPNAMFAMQFIFWVFGVVFVGAVLAPLTIQAMKDDPPPPPRGIDETDCERIDREIAEEDAVTISGEK